MVEEARLEQLDGGLTPVTEGWFVVNVRDAAWVTNQVLGTACTFEGEGTPPFGEMGFTLGVLQPGRAEPPLYHRESNQEDFLVLAERVPVAESRREPTGFARRASSHCPPRDGAHLRRCGTNGSMPDLHGRWAPRVREERSRYPQLGACDFATAQASRPRRACRGRLQRRFRSGSPGPPESWDGLPWALGGESSGRPLQ